jgi:hypothetical protein
MIRLVWMFVWDECGGFKRDVRGNDSYWCWLRTHNVGLAFPLDVARDYRKSLECGTQFESP